LTTILEALDLALGPDRLNRQPPIDEHDFFRGAYLPMPAAPPAEAAEAVEGGGEAGPPAEAPAAEPPRIEIEVTVADLTEEQKGRFGDYTEFWDGTTDTFYDEPNPAGVDAATITEALRVTFLGWYDAEEDDFEGKTYFTRRLTEGDRPESFSKKHTQVCGFLYLRSLRTGSRALSLERGSLLDIILRLKEVRPQMWEATLGTLAGISVASDPKLGISPVLESINTALKKYVPKEWGVEPHLKVSNLTREHLRKVITAFIATGDGDHAAPFYRQGTGTINMLVLAMLSQIAQDKQNVIFAMEEPETAIAPYAQKRIVHEVRKLASQTLFTSHSPYVLEEFAVEETVVLGRDGDGVLEQKAITLPDNVKLKRYRQQFRTRFCEGLLARRVLVAEGATETSAFPVACRRLAELRADTYASLEALGVCIVDAGGETDIPGMAKLYRDLGKRTFDLRQAERREQRPHQGAGQAALNARRKRLRGHGAERHHGGRLEAVRQADRLAPGPGPEVSRSRGPGRRCPDGLFRQVERELGYCRFSRAVQRGRDSPMAPGCGGQVEGCLSSRLGGRWPCCRIRRRGGAPGSGRRWS
jgi:putative ATP-dependent endonuclease of OLD family